MPRALLAGACRLQTALTLTLALSLPSPAMAQTPSLPSSVQLVRTENDPLSDAALAILREAYRRVGVDALSTPLPPERSLTALNAGEYFGDVIHMAGIDTPYPNLVRVPVPVISFDALAFTDGRKLSLGSWADLQAHHVCIRRGIKAIERASEGLPQLSVVNQYAFIFNMLKIGRCDVAVLPHSAWLEAERLDIKGLHSIDPPLQSWPLYHYVHKSHAAIVPLLTQALQAMQKSGYLAARQAEFERLVQNARRGIGTPAR